MTFNNIAFWVSREAGKSASKPAARKAGNEWNFFGAVQEGPRLLKSADQKLGKLSRDLGSTKEFIRKSIPIIKTYGQYVGYLNTYYAFVATVAVAVQARQLSDLVNGVNEIAETQKAFLALDAGEKFARNVYKLLQYELATTAKMTDKEEHIYFLYHPDTDWHKDFYALIQAAPLSKRFYGFCEDLQALCLWMRFQRSVVNVNKEKFPNQCTREVVFHLLMPSYREFCLEQRLKFSEELNPLIIQGDIHNGMPLVSLRLAEDDDCTTENIKVIRPGWPRWLDRGKPMELGKGTEEADEAVRNGMRADPQIKRVAGWKRKSSRK